MAITRAQQARQLYKNGSMKKIKGQNHMLAYITPGERDMLVDLGGQETMTKEGILAYPPGGGDWGGSMSEGGGTDRGRDNTGGDDEPNPGDRDTFNPETGRENSSGGPGPGDNRDFDRYARDRQLELARIEKQRIADVKAELDRQERVAQQEAAAKAKAIADQKAKEAKELSELGIKNAFKGFFSNLPSVQIARKLASMNKNPNRQIYMDSLKKMIL